MAAETESVVVESSDLPMKRQREEDEEENGVSAASTVSMDTDTDGATKNPDFNSNVIPGWFSEISPMWPGWFSSLFNSLFL